MTISDQRSLPGPEIRDDAAPFWAGATNHRLMLKWCTSCGEVFYYPRPFCPFCMSRETIWQEACGRGKIYSFTVVRAKGVPVAVPAFVTLDEGPTVLSALIVSDLDTLAIDQVVHLAFTASDTGQTVPVFTKHEE